MSFISVQATKNPKECSIKSDVINGVEQKERREETRRLYGRFPSIFFLLSFLFFQLRENCKLMSIISIDW